MNNNRAFSNQLSGIVCFSIKPITTSIVHHDGSNDEGILYNQRPDRAIVRRATKTHHLENQLGNLSENDYKRDEVQSTVQTQM